MGETKLINKEGKRIDGREAKDLRSIKIRAHPLKRADGSCSIEWGKNKVIATVYGPKEAQPKHLQDPLRAILRCNYDMASFSVEERKRPGPDRRSVEISKVIGEALENAVLTNLFPRAAIDVNIEVLDADAGTRCAGLVAAGVALADAGIPMKDIPVACAGGKIDGALVVDLIKEEDQAGQADMPVAILPRTQEILLLQMDGELSQEEFDKLLELIIESCLKISALQKKALLDKYHYEGEAEEVREEEKEEER
jgi:exosome complex component RRP41